MARVKIADLPSLPTCAGKPRVLRVAAHPGKPADVTLINLNLMLMNHSGRLERQNYVPLGLLYIAACLQEKGRNVEFIDYQLFSHAVSFNPRLFARAAGRMARVVGISCMSNLLPFAIVCAEEIKRRQPECEIVLGGVGPSPVAGEILKAFPFVDSVVRGEGELVMPEMVEHGVVPRPPRRVPADLDALPLPAYRMLNFALYDAAPSLITSRGCSCRCRFCTEPHNFGGRVRYRSVESVIEELEFLHILSGRRRFLFQDDALPRDRQRFARLMRAMRGLSFPIEWKCFARVDDVDEEMMREMAASGCVQIRYGVESGSNEILSRIRKDITIQQAYDVAVRSVKYFPSVHASFMWGFPFEDMTAFEETMTWVSRFEKAGVTVLLFEYSPLPGSAIYKECKKGLTFSPHHYSRYVITGHETITPGRLQVGSAQRSAFRLVAEHREIFSGFYHHKDAATARKRSRLGSYALVGRTPIKNECDL